NHDPAAGVATHSRTVTDPVCGMSVDPARAAGSHSHDGTTYYFCSTSCAAKFAADTEKYLHDDTAKDHSCCAHPPQVVSLGSATQADTGHACCHGDTAADRPAARIRSTSATYICPMCPGVESD